MIPSLWSRKKDGFTFWGKIKNSHFWQNFTQICRSAQRFFDKKLFWSIYTYVVMWVCAADFSQEPFIRFSEIYEVWVQKVMKNILSAFLSLSPFWPKTVQNFFFGLPFGRWNGPDTILLVKIFLKNRSKKNLGEKILVFWSRSTNRHLKP